MSKYTATERVLVKSIVASLSIKRISESEIMQEVFSQTNKTLSRSGLFRVKQSMKKESTKWMVNLAKNGYEYIHMYKERIDEIIWLQRKHHELIDKFADNAHIIQSSLQELHRLNITLSNYLDVAPELDKRYKMNEISADNYQKNQELDKLKAELDQLRIRDAEREKLLSNITSKSIIPQDDLDKEEEEKQELICYCNGSIMNHYECSKCGHVWCPEDKTLTLEHQNCPKCAMQESS